jgi:multidrug transporter EmrE-like cation transporter
MLLPSVSSAMLDFRIARLAWGGLGTILRVLIVWYLLQEPVHNSFNAN